MSDRTRAVLLPFLVPLLLASPLASQTRPASAPEPQPGPGTRPAATQRAPTRPATAPAAAAAVPLPRVSAPSLRLERLYLVNGVQALLLREPAAPMVGVFAVIRAGLRHERAGEDGLSHFLEHLLFNGTDTMSQEQLYAAVDRLGGYSNATTRTDHTVFQMLVPREHLRKALEIHAAMLFRSRFPVEKFDKERGIVLEEIAKDAASPTTAVEDAFRRLAWEGTPLGRPVIGSPETLGSITREAVMSYWKRRYVPANVTVLVVGSAGREELRAALEATYGKIPPGPPTEPDRPLLMPRAAGGKLRTMDAKTPALELRVAFPGPDPTDPESYIVDVLASLASTSPEASLSRALQDAGFATAKAELGLERVAGAGAILAGASAEAGTDPEAFLRALLQAVASLPDRVTAHALEQFRTRLTVSSALLAEKPHYFGISKAALLVNGGAGAVEGEGPAQSSVDLEALRDATSRWLVDRPFVALAAAPGLPDATRSLGDPAAAGAREDLAAEPGWTTTTLPNGLTLSVSSNPASSVFAAHVLVRDRSQREPRPGTAELLHRLLGKRGLEFEGRVASIGAELKTCDDPTIPFDDYYSVPEWSFVRLETADAYAAPAAALLAEILGPPAFSDEELTRARAEQLQVVKNEQKSASARSRRALGAALYGADHPLAASLVGDEAGVEATSRDELLAFARGYLVPEQMIVTVESGRPAAEVTDLLVRSLGALARGQGPGPVARTAPPPAREEPPPGPQAYVRLGSTLSVAREDRAAATLAAAVLSERLAMDIREKRGMAYSIGASLVLRDGRLPDAWLAAAGTRPDNVQEVGDAMREDLRGLRQAGPTAEEVELAAGRLAGRELMRRLAAIGRAYAAGLDIWRGDLPGASLELIRSLGTVDAARVKQVLERDFDPARAQAVVAR